jgi:F-type H+-transporting ATPase subunit b
MPVTLDLPLLSWDPLHFDPGTLVWTWAVFGVVVFVLAKFAWNPLVAALEAREKKMEEGILKAERAEAAARRTAAEMDEKLKDAYAKAEKIVEETRARGEQLGKELETQARAQADKLITQAREEIDLAKAQAAEELRTQAVDLALEAAATVLRRNVSQDDNRRLAREAIDLMQRGKPGPGAGSVN